MRDRGAQTEAKRRYNSKHYEQIMLRVPRGARCTVQDLATVAGLSMAEYIRHCIIADAMQRGYDVTDAIGGGELATLTAAANSRGRSLR